MTNFLVIFLNFDGLIGLLINNQKQILIVVINNRPALDWVVNAITKNNKGRISVDINNSLFLNFK